MFSLINVYILYNVNLYILFAIFWFIFYFPLIFIFPHWYCLWMYCSLLYCWNKLTYLLTACIFTMLTDMDNIAIIQNWVNLMIVSIQSVYLLLIYVCLGCLHLIITVWYISSLLMYGSETWALRKAEQDGLERREMRMLRWMMGIKRIEKIRTK